MKPWMLALAVAVMFGGACKKKGPRTESGYRWEGIPATRACDWSEHTATCISEDKVYTCVLNESPDGCDSPSVNDNVIVCAPREQKPTKE